MAETPTPELIFDGRCPDCGRRRIELPGPLPELGDDFDWRVRDYDGFRLAMLEELAARFPERRRWTPADLEVVLVEVVASALDQLSDMLDRVSAESYLETARRPESVRRLLGMLGYDAVEVAKDAGRISTEPEAGAAPGETASRELLEERLDRFWLESSFRQEEARRAGPRAVHTQRRMVTLDDYARRLEDHPLVLRAHATSRWTGSWTTLRVATVLWNDLLLDQTRTEGGAPLSLPADVRMAVEAFHARHDLTLPDLEPPPTLRAILRPYLEAFRMVGQEVELQDARQVPVTFAISVRVASNFFQSEVRDAIRQALGREAGGFFAPGSRSFGEDLHSSDLIETVMAMDGVETACLNRFKRLGDGFEDQTAAGVIVLDGLELVVCDNLPDNPSRGYYRLTLHGGQPG